MIKKLLIVMGLLLIMAQGAMAADIGIGVTPGKLNFELAAPDTGAEKSVYVMNTGTEAAVYEISIDNPDYADWFTISPASFKLKPGAHKEITLKLTVPASGDDNATCKLKVLRTSETNIKAGVKIPIQIGQSSENSTDSDSSDSDSSDSDSSDSGSSDSDSSDSGSSGSSSSGSSSSGRMAAFSPEDPENILLKEIAMCDITTGVRAKYEFKADANEIRYIEFDPKKTFGKTPAITEILKTKSVLTPVEPEGKVYKHMNIWIGISGVSNPQNIENSAVGFRVDKDWVNENGINESLITLSHFSDGKWNPLPTLKTNEDAKYLYFEAKTPGFSPFAITENQKAQAILRAEDKTGTQSQNKTSEEQNNTSEGEKTGGIPGFEWGSAAAGLILSIGCIKRIRKN